MTNAQKQKRYRKKLAEKRRIEVTQTMEITTELMNAKYKIRQLELHDHDTEQLSIGFQKLKEENRRLKKENQALRTKKPKTVETDGNVIKFPPPDTDTSDTVESGSPHRSSMRAC